MTINAYLVILESHDKKRTEMFSHEIYWKIDFPIMYTHINVFYDFFYQIFFFSWYLFVEFNNISQYFSDFLNDF